MVATGRTQGPRSAVLNEGAAGCGIDADAAPAYCGLLMFPYA